MQSFVRRHRHYGEDGSHWGSESKQQLQQLLGTSPSSFPTPHSSLGWRARMSSPVPVRRDVLLFTLSLTTLLLLWSLFSVFVAPFLSSSTSSSSSLLSAFGRGADAPLTFDSQRPEDLWLQPDNAAEPSEQSLAALPSLGGRHWMYVQTLHYGDYQRSLAKLNELSYLTNRARCYAVTQDYNYAINLGPEEMRAAMSDFVQQQPQQAQQSKLEMTVFGFDKPDPNDSSNVIHMPALSGPWYRVLLMGLALHQPQLLLRHTSMSYASTKLRDSHGRVRPLDYVLFSDVDAVISNASRPLDELIRVLPPRCWLIVQDLEYVANAGVVIMRQSLEARQFIALWLDQWLSRDPSSYWQADQGAMMEAILLWLSQRSAKYHGKLDYEPGLCWNLRSNNDTAVHEHPALRWMLTWTKADGTSQDQVWIQNACFGSILKHWGFANKERGNLDGVCLLPIHDSSERPDMQIFRFNCHWCGQPNDWFIHHEINRNWGQFVNYTQQDHLVLGMDDKCQFTPGQAPH